MQSKRTEWDGQQRTWIALHPSSNRKWKLEVFSSGSEPDYMSWSFHKREMAEKAYQAKKELFISQFGEPTLEY